MMMKREESCPCHSGKTYGECCAPILEDGVKAPTAEALMRARYSAYVVGNVEFLKTSVIDEAQKEFDYNVSQAWSQSSTWHGLEILRVEKGGPDDTTGIVEFRARYTAGGEFCNHHEVSEFRKENGEWRFVDGTLVGETPQRRETPKVGRNDPCPCGSGKKYKKCCGKGL